MLISKSAPIYNFVQRIYAYIIFTLCMGFGSTQ